MRTILGYTPLKITSSMVGPEVLCSENTRPTLIWTFPKGSADFLAKIKCVIKPRHKQLDVDHTLYGLAYA
jgi:hypothetical protein